MRAGAGGCSAPLPPRVFACMHSLALTCCSRALLPQGHALNQSLSSPLQAVFLLIGKTSALTMNIAGVIKDW